jgi:hypothetical protein
LVASLSSHSPKEGCYAKRLKMGAEFKIDEDREEKETYEKWALIHRQAIEARAMNLTRQMRREVMTQIPLGTFINS